MFTFQNVPCLMFVVLVTLFAWQWIYNMIANLYFFICNFSHKLCVATDKSTDYTVRCVLNVNTVSGSTAGNRVYRGVAYVQTIQNIGKNRRKWKRRRRRKNNALVYFAIPLLLLHDNISLEVFSRLIRCVSLWIQYSIVFGSSSFFRLLFRIVDFVYARSMLFFWQHYFFTRSFIPSEFRWSCLGCCSCRSCCCYCCCFCCCYCVFLGKYRIRADSVCVRSNTNIDLYKLVSHCCYLSANTWIWRRIYV